MPTQQSAPLSVLTVLLLIASNVFMNFDQIEEYKEVAEKAAAC